MKSARQAEPYVHLKNGGTLTLQRLMRSTSILAISLGLPFVAATAANAQSTTPRPDVPTATVQEVIVTAQKRSENLQDVPVSVQAITAGQALSQGLTGTAALTGAVPGLVITNPANVGNPYLRGVGSALFDPSSEQSVAMYVDGVYIAAVGSFVVIWMTPPVALRPKRVPWGPFRTSICWMLLKLKMLLSGEL